MRLLFLLLSLFILAEAGICQQVTQISADSTGNTSAIYMPEFDAEKNLHQAGYGNFVFAYSRQDSSDVQFRVSQSGSYNQVFSVSGNQAGPFIQVLRQHGSENRIENYQGAKADTLNQSRQEVNVEQKGSGNSVTIIQRDK